MKVKTKRKTTRNEGFMMFLNLEEKQMLLNLAQRQGISMSAWVRKEIREAAILQGVWIPNAQAE